MNHGGCTYILTNKHHTVLYIGVTSDLYNRIKEHKEKTYPKSFTARYNCGKLVWYECYSSITEAIAFEKFYKGKTRAFKINLINSRNPEWKDLWEEMKDW
jgi:putative endonuclease